MNVGEETTQLLKDNSNKKYLNLQTYNDLFQNSLGSLNLLIIPGPKQLKPELKKFCKNIFLSIEIYKIINDYLDIYSSNSLRCCSKNLKSAIDLSKNYDPNNDQQLFRIDPINFLNKLRGIVISDVNLSQQMIHEEKRDIESTYQTTTQYLTENNEKNLFEKIISSNWLLYCILIFLIVYLFHIAFKMFLLIFIILII